MANTKVFAVGAITWTKIELLGRLLQASEEDIPALADRAKSEKRRVSGKKYRY